MPIATGKENFQSFDWNYSGPSAYACNRQVPLLHNTVEFDYEGDGLLPVGSYLIFYRIYKVDTISQYQVRNTKNI